METQKLLFAYDGTSCANDALVDLARAGLSEEMDMLVVSVAEEWVLNVDDDDSLSDDFEAAVHVVAVSPHAKQAMERAQVYTDHAVHKLQTMFPKWSIASRVYPDSPSWGVLHAADEWLPDLIVLGSHGRSALGRFFLGSVSQKVLTESHCSVRVARHRDTVAGSPLRLVVGVDGTPDSKAAVAEIVSRHWPAGTSIRVCAAVGPIGAFIAPVFPYEIGQWTEEQLGAAKLWHRMEEAVNLAAKQLHTAGLIVDVAIRDSAPTQMILSEANELGADCIFIGARGHRFMERFILGSVSAAVAARASCSVEVVRLDKKSESHAFASHN